MIISCFDYYRDINVRDICHKAKDGDEVSLLRMAYEMSVFVNKDDVLIPSPSRNGYAEKTLVISNEISRITGCSIQNIITGKKRCSLYNLKLSGNDINDSFFGFKNKHNKVYRNSYIVDTVYDTGRTTSEILKCVKNANILVYARVFN